MSLIQKSTDPLLDGFLSGIEGIDDVDKYKDPFDPQWLGNPDHITPTQKEIWPIVKETRGCKIALIGGKGSAKTCTASGYLIDRAQRYPGSKAFLAASTYQQATDSCAAELVMVAEMMGIELLYSSERIIDKLPHKNVYYFPEFGSSVCIRSADRMYLIEGSQWDHCAIEEVSFWNEEDLSTALSRLRRPVGDHSRMIVGMPAEEDFWMYRFFEENDFILREIDTRENIQNLPPNYIPDLLRMYPGPLGERYVSGKRVSLHNMPVIPNYDPELHKNSELAKTYTAYDEHRELLVSFDFNVAPCCATVWQSKDIPFEVIRGKVGNYRAETVVKQVLCQIDEFEVWSGGTRAVCDQIYSKYGPDGFDHLRGITILGDAAGNQRDTRNVSVTDWTIISETFSGMRDCTVRRGLIVSNKRNGSSRKIRRRHNDFKKVLERYSNPPLKDSIERFNLLHRDGDGHPGVLYLPNSRFESGGCASSVSGTRYKADGSLDESPDKKDGKKVRRTHFFATARYMSWFFSAPGTKKRRSAKHDSSGFRLRDRRVFKR